MVGYIVRIVDKSLDYTSEESSPICLGSFGDVGNGWDVSSVYHMIRGKLSQVYGDVLGGGTGVLGGMVQIRNVIMLKIIAAFLNYGQFIVKIAVAQ